MLERQRKPPRHQGLATLVLREQPIDDAVAETTQTRASERRHNKHARATELSPRRPRIGVAIAVESSNELTTPVLALAECEGRVDSG